VLRSSAVSPEPKAGLAGRLADVTQRSVVTQVHDLASATCFCENAAIDLSTSQWRNGDGLNPARVCSPGTFARQYEQRFDALAPIISAFRFFNHWNSSIPISTSGAALRLLSTVIQKPELTAYLRGPDSAANGWARETEGSGNA
jgi:hypothetical protein